MCLPFLKQCCLSNISIGFSLSPLANCHWLRYLGLPLMYTANLLYWLCHLHDPQAAELKHFPFFLQIQACRSVNFIHVCSHRPFVSLAKYGYNSGSVYHPLLQESLCYLINTTLECFNYIVTTIPFSYLHLRLHTELHQPSTDTTITP